MAGLLEKFNLSLGRDLINLRRELADLCRSHRLIGGDHTLPGGIRIPQIVTRRGVDLGPLEEKGCQRAVELIKQFVFGETVSGFDDLEKPTACDVDHWSARTKRARKKYRGGKMRSKAPSEVCRGPGRYSGNKP